jgi:hypothetical protein
MTAVMQMIWDEAVQDNKIEIAKNALGEGLSVDIIKKITGLTAKELQELQTGQKADS